MAEYLGKRTEAGYFQARGEFAFIDVIDDVIDEPSFRDNAAIVREVVELLQPYRLRYSKKHPFLGDFFEKLLTSGVKQESGQFFTPPPLARFMAQALPYEDVIERKVEGGEQHVLPYLIDFACGAGHFLTEAADEIDGHLPAVEKITMTKGQRRNFDSHRKSLKWARQFVYGIERDHRLAKTTKIALFLNGDGEANIFNENGLAGFGDRFSGELSGRGPDLRRFDLLLANPPFAVEGFRKQVTDGTSNFSLFRHVTARSDDIECIFIERMIQLLAPGGAAGIILPLGILSDGGPLHTHCRRMLLLNLRLAALVELGGKTFPATPSRTFIAFGVRRQDAELNEAKREVARFLEAGGRGRGNDDLKRCLESLAVAPEAAKMAWDEEAARGAFAMTYLRPSECSDLTAALLISFLLRGEMACVTHAGDKVRDQEAFLGYRVPQKRDANAWDPVEGDDGLIDAIAFSEVDRQNPEKVSRHVRDPLRGHAGLAIPKSLEKHLMRRPLVELVNVGEAHRIEAPSASFTKNVASLNPLGDHIDDWEQEEVDMSSLIASSDVRWIGGITYSKKRDERTRETTVKVLTANNIDVDTARLDPKAKAIYLRDDFVVRDEMVPRAGDIVISLSSVSTKTLRKACLVERDADAMIGTFLGIIRCREPATATAVLHRLLSKSFACTS